MPNFQQHLFYRTPPDDCFWNINSRSNPTVDTILKDTTNTTTKTTTRPSITCLEQGDIYDTFLFISADISKFRYNGLKQHERYRAIHHTPPLELNDLLNQEAQNYSERLASEPKLAYSDPKDRPGQGENIAVRCSDDGSLLTAKEAVSYW